MFSNLNSTLALKLSFVAVTLVRLVVKALELWEARLSHRSSRNLNYTFTYMKQTSGMVLLYIYKA